MADDLSIATATAESELNDEIKQFVPPMFHDRIPPDKIHGAAGRIATAVLAALAKAHAAPDGT